MSFVSAVETVGDVSGITNRCWPAKQSSDPVGEFKRRLASGKEQRVDLEAPVPVHLIYRTAFTTAKGDVQFRRDVYGRDKGVWEALRAAGVEVGGIQS